MPDLPRSTQRIAAAETRARVLKLRRLRMSFEEIGKAVGVNKQRAHQIYTKALAEIPETERAAHRQEELALVDDAIRSLMPIALDREHARVAVEAWLAIRAWAEHKARLLGLYAPAETKIEVITNDVIESEIARLEAKFGENDPGRPVSA